MHSSRQGLSASQVLSSTQGQGTLSIQQMHRLPAQVKRNYVAEFEQKLSRLFQLKHYYVKRNAFQKLLPNQIVSSTLRHHLDGMGLTDHDISKLDSVIRISNAIEKCKDRILDSEYEEFNEALLSNIETILELSSYKRKYEELLESSSKSAQYLLPSLANASPAKRVKSPSPDLHPTRTASFDFQDNNNNHRARSISRSRSRTLSPEAVSNKPLPSPSRTMSMPNIPLSSPPPPSTTNKSKIHPFQDSAVTNPEVAILLEHQEKLTKHIESLDNQLQFLKDRKKQDDDKHHQTVERLVRQVQQLTSVLAKTKEERDAVNSEMSEKDRHLGISLVHLSTAQEEIKRLLLEKESHTSKSQSKVEEERKVNELLQKHSKYSSSQFTKLSSQVDAMRVQLDRERQDRAAERKQAEDSSLLAKQRIHTLESMVKSLEEQLSSLSVNYDGTTTLMMSTASILQESDSPSHQRRKKHVQEEEEGEDDYPKLSITERVKLEQDKHLKEFDKNHVSRALPIMSPSSRKEMKTSHRYPSPATKLLTTSTHTSNTTANMSKKGTVSPLKHRHASSSKTPDKSTTRSLSLSPNKLRTSQTKMQKRMKAIAGVKVSPSESTSSMDEREEERLLLLSSGRKSKASPVRGKGLVADPYLNYSQITSDYLASQYTYQKSLEETRGRDRTSSNSPRFTSSRSLSPRLSRSTTSQVLHQDISQIMNNLNSVLEDLKYPTIQKPQLVPIPSSSPEHQLRLTRTSPSQDESDTGRRSSPPRRSPNRSTSSPTRSLSPSPSPSARSPLKPSLSSHQTKTTSPSSPVKPPSSVVSFPRESFSSPPKSHPSHHTNTSPTKTTAATSPLLHLSSPDRLISVGTSPMRLSQSPPLSPRTSPKPLGKSPTASSNITNNNRSTSPLPSYYLNQERSTQTISSPSPPMKKLQIIDEISLDYYRRLPNANEATAAEEAETNEEELNESTSTIGLPHLPASSVSMSPLRGMNSHSGENWSSPKTSPSGHHKERGGPMSTTTTTMSSQLPLLGRPLSQTAHYEPYKPYLLPNYDTISSTVLYATTSPPEGDRDYHQRDYQKTSGSEETYYCSFAIVEDLIDRYNQLTRECNQLIKSQHSQEKEHEQVKQELREEIQQSVATIEALQQHLQELLRSNNPSANRSTSSVLAGLSASKPNTSRSRSNSPQRSPSRQYESPARVVSSQTVTTSQSFTSPSPSRRSQDVKPVKTPVSVTKIQIDTGEALLREFSVLYPEIVFPLQSELFPFLTQPPFTTTNRNSANTNTNTSNTTNTSNHSPKRSSSYSSPLLTAAQIDLSTVPSTEELLQSLESMILLLKTDMYRLQAVATNTTSSNTSTATKEGEEYKLLMRLSDFQQWIQYLLVLKMILQRQFHETSDLQLALQQEKESLARQVNSQQEIIREKVTALQVLQETMSLTRQHQSEKEQVVHSLSLQQKQYEEKVKGLERELERIKSQHSTSQRLQSIPSFQSKTGIQETTTSNSLYLSYSPTTSPLSAARASIRSEKHPINTSPSEKRLSFATQITSSSPLPPYRPPPHPTTTTKTHERGRTGSRDDVEEEEDDSSSFDSSVVQVVDDLRKHPSQKNLKPNLQQIHLFQSMEDLPSPTKSSKKPSPLQSSPQRHPTATSFANIERSISEDLEISPDKDMNLYTPALTKYQSDLQTLNQSLSEIQLRAAMQVEQRKEQDQHLQQQEISQLRQDLAEVEAELRASSQRNISSKEKPKRSPSHSHSGDSLSPLPVRTRSQSPPLNKRDSHNKATPTSDYHYHENSHTNHHTNHAEYETLVRELEEQLSRESRKNEILLEQIQSMPVSLTVAQAEKRVLEGKLAKATEAYEYNLQKIQQYAVQKVKESDTFLQLEKQEKEELQRLLKEQMETIHQLTHHVKILQASTTASSNSLSSAQKGGIGSMNLSLLRSPEHTGLQQQLLQQQTTTTSTSTQLGGLDLPSARKAILPATPVLQQSYSSSSGRKTAIITSSLASTPGSSLHYPTMRSRVFSGVVGVAEAAPREVTEVELEVPPPPWDKRNLPSTNTNNSNNNTRRSTVSPSPVLRPLPSSASKTITSDPPSIP